MCVIDSTESFATVLTLIIFQIDQSSLGLNSRDYYLVDSLYGHQILAYKKYIKDVITILTGDLNLGEVSDGEIDEIVDFEKRLANITIKQEDRKNFTSLYNSRTIEQLTQMLPFVIEEFYDKR